MENEQNENKKDDIKKRSSEIKLLIEKYKKSLKEIQEECNHEPLLKLVSENGRSSSLRIVCKNCEKIIGYPSASDTNDFYDD
tara:strand:+ start:2064 stop:2309 length:246 start_codon:yes stop_codon:yes gene_type:complete